MSKITVLEAENFKRLKAIRIEPDGSVVVLNGKNRSGKSSTLDAIWAALGGKEASPEVPIRDGARKAVARVTLDSGIVVERTWSTSGATKLVITGTEGERLSSPQSVLNELCSKHTVDPLAFATMDSRKQAVTLKQIVGLDFAGLDARRKVLYDKRTETNRDVKRLEAQLAGSPLHDPNAPEAEVSLSALHEEYREAMNATVQHEGRKKTLTDIEAENVALQVRIEKARAALEQLECAFDDRERWIASERQAIKADEAELPDPIEISKRTLAIQATNAAVRANKIREEVKLELSDVANRSFELTTEIEAIDEQKAAQLEAAQFPVEGLGFDENGVTYKGLPFAQASHAERLRVSTAIGLALNPSLRVLLIRDAEKLDDDGMRMIAALADEHDAQLWLERAGHSDPGAVVIEDGEVAE